MTIYEILVVKLNKIPKEYRDIVRSLREQFEELLREPKQ
mgnify:FL=1